MRANYLLLALLMALSACAHLESPDANQQA